MSLVRTASWSAVGMDEQGHSAISDVYALQEMKVYASLDWSVMTSD